MGVPALFRWLSKKYPKIIYPVVEEEEIKVPAQDGSTINIPVNMSMTNPNGKEFDNLYLDMNGIVHPCTHPEGKPAPETEEEMMIEIFKYTERVVNMVRPRKLLFMAIDGTAPRAKMNQQRSRRFRAAQEAKDKEASRAESLLLWEAMGKEITDLDRKESWDTNAITPGTPFMELLAISLRYWVVHKINNDPGWKNIQVLISDAGVPGEGEHKIMDFIRRQRVNPGHNPNTRHVIYGLDADLIMLGIATHEPQFWVLREDVFADANSTACRKCGQEGHYAAQCTTTEVIEVKKEPDAQKPFIFLDIAILREYLEVELDVTQIPFPFNFEQALDDWVLLIFFVGNDFLPHLPSLEIREGAIDTLLRIWKQELPRMGGYLTNHGHIVLERAQIILEGLAQREDEIFRRRREAENRQDQNAKRRKLEEKKNVRPSSSLALTAPPTAPSGPPVHHPLPPRPNFAANADSMGFGAAPTIQSSQNAPIAAQALAGSNRDVVANRRAIRMANMSAAEMLKAELSGAVPVKPNLSLPAKPATTAPGADSFIPSTPATDTSRLSNGTLSVPDEGIPGFGNHPPSTTTATPSLPNDDAVTVVEPAPETDADAEGEVDTDEPMNGDSATMDTTMNSDDDSTLGAGGLKRKLSDMSDVVDETLGDEEDDAPPDVSIRLKVNADGTVDQEDKVQLWEPGYKGRYYAQKFPESATDPDLKKKITKAYIEGLAWVLHYYYQGTPSWQWFYPYHFAPFAADFVDIKDMSITFTVGNPFKPFEQLMGVFPPESRKHIPTIFHSLMLDKRSPLRGASAKEIDFYPEDFLIDMNGKKMAWQGVALLSFIDEEMLLSAMAKPFDFLPADERPELDISPDLPPPSGNEPPYTIYLNQEERRRNKWGNNVIFASDEHPLYPFYEQLYGKRKSRDPVPLDIKLSSGISGTVSPNPDCIPGSTYFSVLPDLMPDIKNDKSLSVFYYFPKQLSPHRSVLLPGALKPRGALNASDLETVRRGGRGRGGGGGGGGQRGSWNNNGGSDRGGRNDPFHSRSNYGHQNSYGNDRGRGGDRGGGYRGNNSYQQPYPPPRQQQHQQQQQQQQQHQPQQYGGYNNGAARQPQNYGAYGAPHGASRGGPPVGYNSYGQQGQQGQGGYNTNTNYGVYGAPPAAAYSAPPTYGGYGGYAGQGQGQQGQGQGQGGYPTDNGSGYNNGRGGYNNNARGRGRGW
ncbi:XRN 5'-3' exonuclease N-terminus-domain-containing protein [Mycena rosella]|uniref:5'-3' exoribonuclease n=1 Tax=Mycena rosella TaxID=1033263 RepID=A0AAD7DCN6_MYCRO|nr:XRN 5'-3' exonuclease N-terminus-domain-containing protein [Mycena rosella]